jgi:hypothetical protein
LNNCARRRVNVECSILCFQDGSEFTLLEVAFSSGMSALA